MSTNRCISMYRASTGLVQCEKLSGHENRPSGITGETSHLLHHARGLFWIWKNEA